MSGISTIGGGDALASFGFGRRSPFQSSGSPFSNDDIVEVPENDCGTVPSRHVAFAIESAYTATAASKQQQYQDRDWARIQSTLERGINMNDHSKGVEESDGTSDNADSDVEVFGDGFGGGDGEEGTGRPGFACILPTGPTARDKKFIKAMPVKMLRGTVVD